MKTSRPKDDGERDECIDAAAAAAKKSGLSQALVVALADMGPVEATYLAARSEEKVVEARATADRKALVPANAEFGRTCRLWTSTVRTPDGKPNPSGVAKLFDGVLPSSLLRMRPRDEIAKTADLELQVKNDPSVAGDLAKLRDFVGARDALAVVVTAEDLSSAAHTAALQARKAAEKAFDAAWSDVARAMRKSAPEIAALAPVFVRVKADKSDESDKSCEPDASPTSPPSPEPGAAGEGAAAGEETQAA